MPSFEYKALNARGQEMSGKINANNQNQAIKQLQEKSLYPLNIKKVKDSAGLHNQEGQKFKLNIFKKTVTDTMLADFSRQFGTLIETGIPYNRALEILSQSLKGELLLETIAEINLKVVEGSSLTNAMSNYPDIFPKYYLTSIMAGEKTGTLGKNMVQQAEFLENQTDLKNKIQSALIYPGIMSFLGISIVIFMIKVILPKIVPIFGFFDHALPLPTRMMIWISDFMSNNTYLLLFGLLAVLISINYATKSKQGKVYIDKLILKIPLLSKLMHKVYLLRFTMAFSSLLESGIAVKEALNIATDSTGNSVFSKSIKEVEFLTVNKGYSFSQALKKTELFDEKFIQVVKVGEESGQLAKMINRLSENLKRETNGSIQKFVSLLEPMIIIMMALMVGTIVLAILLPIFEMNQLIQ